MDQVSDHVYVGSKLDAENRDEMQKFGIESVISFELSSVPDFVKAHYYLGAADKQPVEGEFLRSAFGFMHSQVAQGRNVLIHCQAGISRSPSFVAGYLALRYGIRVSDAVSIVKSKHSVSAPHPVFLQSIEDFVCTEYDRLMGA